jgi:hypothetical protein
LLASIGVMSCAAAAWLWPLGLIEQHLGVFTFLGPRELQSGPGGCLAGAGFDVSLLAEEPTWVTSTETVEIAGREASLERTAPFAPVVGGSLGAPDVRDRGIRIWLPSLGSGLELSWRTYGGWWNWMSDTRLDRTSEVLVRSITLAEVTTTSR